MKRKPSSLIRGTGTHRRTESDYMGVLLDAVSLDDWRDVVTGTLARAKEGDPAARAWLAQYLVGKPEAKAPAPLTVLVQQWSASDPLAERLAKPIIDRNLYPNLHENDDLRDAVRTAITAELTKTIENGKPSKTPATLDKARDSGDSAV
ncbi:MAG: hypothetical protein LBI62_08625 [Candidatus Accumulibacter sp.]|jgi:hypothetical protein|nr:hypothetical protein [Accumulibacter sp.]